MATHSGLLSKLPPELRNRVYELTFQGKDHGSEKIYLLTAKGPDKALLLTSKAIHQEAKGIYNSAYRAYWRTNKFILDRPLIRVAHSAMQHPSASDADLDHIQSLTVSCIEDGGEIVSWVYQPNNDKPWRQLVSNDGKESFPPWDVFIMMPRVESASLQNLRIYDLKPTSKKLRRATVAEVLKWILA